MGISGAWLHALLRHIRIRADRGRMEDQVPQRHGVEGQRPRCGCQAPRAHVSRWGARELHGRDGREGHGPAPGGLHRDVAAARLRREHGGVQRVRGPCRRPGVLRGPLGGPRRHVGPEGADPGPRGQHVFLCVGGAFVRLHARHGYHRLRADGRRVEDQIPQHHIFQGPERHVMPALLSASVARGHQHSRVQEFHVLHSPSRMYEITRHAMEVF
mmetsp:Transcript_92595/g.283575  ORF Transcript_92595/g.283575 Transcript_92595/m.283575 type:complete len:214 (+) Transcript_92595:477-1118(+)